MEGLLSHTYTYSQTNLHAIAPTKPVDSWNSKGSCRWKYVLFSERFRAITNELSGWMDKLTTRIDLIPKPLHSFS